MDVSLKHPFSMLASGGSDVGKTEFTKKSLKSKLIAPSPECIAWCFAKHQQNLFEELMKLNVEYLEGIPKVGQVFHENNEALKILKITQLFTRGRHGNLSVVYLTQNLFHENQRALSLNSDYIVIFKNPRDNSQLAAITRQIRLDKVKFFMWAYKDVTSSAHTYLMLDLKPGTEERFRVQRNILEDPQHVHVTH